MYFNCDNPNEHKREGEGDYERHGSWGYDSQKYRDEQDDCHRAYTDGFDEARRYDESRQEERVQEEAEERHRYERQMEIRQQEEYEYEQQMCDSDEIRKQEQEREVEPKSDDLPF